MLATVLQQLKSNGQNDVYIQNLGLNGGAHAQSCIQVGKPFEDRAALLLLILADSHVHKPSE